MTSLTDEICPSQIVLLFALYDNVIFSFPPLPDDFVPHRRHRAGYIACRGQGQLAAGLNGTNHSSKGAPKRGGWRLGFTRDGGECMQMEQPPPLPPTPFHPPPTPVPLQGQALGHGTYAVYQGHACKGQHQPFSVFGRLKSSWYKLLAPCAQRQALPWPPPLPGEHVLESERHAAHPAVPLCPLSDGRISTSVGMCLLVPCSHLACPLDTSQGGQSCPIPPLPCPSPRLLQPFPTARFLIGHRPCACGGPPRTARSHRSHLPLHCQPPPLTVEAANRSPGRLCLVSRPPCPGSGTLRCRLVSA